MIKRKINDFFTPLGPVLGYFGFVQSIFRALRRFHRFRRLKPQSRLPWAIFDLNKSHRLITESNPETDHIDLFLF